MLTIQSHKIDKSNSIKLIDHWPVILIKRSMEHYNRIIQYGLWFFFSLYTYKRGWFCKPVMKSSGNYCVYNDRCWRIRVLLDNILVYYCYAAYIPKSYLEHGTVSKITVETILEKKKDQCTDKFLWCNRSYSRITIPTDLIIRSLLSIKAPLFIESLSVFMSFLYDYNTHCILFTLNVNISYEYKHYIIAVTKTEYYIINVTLKNMCMTRMSP